MQLLLIAPSDRLPFMSNSRIVFLWDFWSIEVEKYMEMAKIGKTSQILA